MLSTLDTVIAFAVIMTVLSLLITIIVQIVSALFSLRGKNLANALALTFQTIDPKIKEHAYSLAAQILRDPIFSDSVRQKKDRSPKPVTPATEAFANAERRLKDATKKLEEATKALALENNPDNQAAVVAADKEFTDASVEFTKAKADPGVEVPSVDPNRKEPWGFFTMDSTKLGTAIRPGEVYRIIHEFAALSKTEAAIRDIPSELVEKSASLIAALTKSDQPAQESRKKLETIANVADVFATEAQKKAVVDALANFGMTVERATTLAYDRFQRWFGSAQDRAEQWFQMHIRSVTVGAAIVTALVLQLDTIEIFRTLRANPKLVDALVKSAPGVLEQGATVLDQSDNSAYYTYLLWLKKHPLFSLDTLPTPGDQKTYARDIAARIKLPPDSRYPTEDFKKTLNDAGKMADGVTKPEASALQSAYHAWIEKFPVYTLKSPPKFESETKESLTQKIAEEVNNDVEKQKTAPTGDWVSEYDRLYPEGVKAFQTARAKTFDELRKKIDEAGFDLAPSPFFGRWKEERGYGWLSLRHLLGLLMTAGLLSLGAPFWFNLLKNLMSLRPAVANLMEKRPTSAPALPATPDKPVSPS